LRKVGAGGDRERRLQRVTGRRGERFEMRGNEVRDGVGRRRDERKGIAVHVSNNLSKLKRETDSNSL